MTARPDRGGAASTATDRASVRNDGPREARPRNDGPREARPRNDGPREAQPRNDGPREAQPRNDGLRRVNVIQGETRVSDEDVVMTTVLGSCIAARLYDPVMKVGGLNHFLLAEPGDGGTDPSSMQRYGVYAMEVLINAMLALGAARSRLKARIYGGASMRDGFRDIGAANARFARGFLAQERIALTGEDTGGVQARRVEFRPTLGLARCRHVTDTVRVAPPRLPPRPVSTGDVDFF